MVPPGKPLPRDAALIILPGSKATIADLAVLRREGWDIDIAAIAVAAGTCSACAAATRCSAGASPIPDGSRAWPAKRAGLGLLDIETVLGRQKRLADATGTDLATGKPVRGYEMHLGRTTGPGLARPMLDLGGRPDGAVSADGRVAGCYLHGLFADDGFRRAFLARLGAERPGAASPTRSMIDAILDRLADHLEAAPRSCCGARRRARA